MAELQRSSISFRRQGSSGLVWDDRFLSGKRKNHHHQHLFYSGELVRPDGGGGHHPLRSSMPDDEDHNRQELRLEFNLRPIRTGRSPVADEGLCRNEHNAEEEDQADPSSPKLFGCGCCGGFIRSSKSGQRSRTPMPRSA